MKKYKKFKCQKNPRRGIIKKFSPEVLKFEHLLKKSGYYDNSPIIKNVQKVEQKILNKYTLKYNIEIIGFIYYYPNKKSYIWRCYNELINDPKLTKREALRYLNIVCNGIIFSEKTRIAEVGWEIRYVRNIISKSKKDLTSLYFEILKDLKSILKEEFCGISPKPGDIIIGRPRGYKFGLNKIGTGDIGSKQRGLSTQKFLNFGKTNEWNEQYARYDEDLNLHPT